MGDWPQAAALCSFLDRLDREGALPETIVYDANPADDYAIATAIGSFRKGPIAGKIQFGSGWWFLDQRKRSSDEFNALSHTGLLSRFIGMLTDSRSFMSFPRRYFRRITLRPDRRRNRGSSANCRMTKGCLAHWYKMFVLRNAQRYLGLGLSSVEAVERSATSTPSKSN